MSKQMRDLRKQIEESVSTENELNAQIDALRKEAENEAQAAVRNATMKLQKELQGKTKQCNNDSAERTTR